MPTRTRYTYRLHIGTTNPDAPPILTNEHAITPAMIEQFTALAAKANEALTWQEKLTSTVLDAFNSAARDGDIFAPIGHCPDHPGIVSVNLGCIQTITVEIVDYGTSDE